MTRDSLDIVVTNDGPLTLQLRMAAKTDSREFQSVDLAVNGTNALSANVNIRLSIDGGIHLPASVLANTPNDGSESVTAPDGVPDVSTARMMVESALNDCVVFFDVSNANFDVNSDCAGCTTRSAISTGWSLPRGSVLDDQLRPSMVLPNSTFTLTPSGSSSSDWNLYLAAVSGSGT